jgi:hypothetical protein
MIYIRLLALMVCTILLVACQTSDTTLREQGHNDSYIVGFHDGRHSGMREAGNNFEHFIQDRKRYDDDDEYREGWLAGEEEGRKVQAQADAIGDGAAAGIAADQAGKSSKKHGMSKKAMEDAVRGVDTSSLENLEK